MFIPEDDAKFQLLLTLCSLSKHTAFREVLFLLFFIPTDFNLAALIDESSVQPTCGTTSFPRSTFCVVYTGCLQKNGVVSKVNKKLISHLTRHNVHRQQWKLSKFLMRYQQFASHA